MIKLRTFVLLGMLTLLIAGCASGPAPASPPLTDTPVPPTPTDTPIPPTPTATPVPPSVFALPDMLVARLEIQIPPEVASGAVPRYVGRGQEHEEVGQILPRHIILEFQDYPFIPGDQETPALRLFTVNGMKERFDDQIRDLLLLLGGHPTQLARIPAFPIMEPSMLQTRLVNPLGFQSGYGVRFLNFDPIMVDGQMVDLAVSYVFQGFTWDQAYFISIILPVDLPALRQQGYALMTEAALNPTPQPIEFMLGPLLGPFAAAEDSDFIPSLAILDTMIQSLLIVEE